uniref:FERM domain-containing protein n=1 Tax=Arion vulgaris TaxID=1028688 RepID=A0A0B7AQ35_9EUPU
MTAKLATGGKKHKLVNVHLLDGSEYITYVDVKSKFQEIFNQVTGHICLRETEYFGLAFKKDNEYQFVVLDEKIHKHAPKHWKSGPGEGVDKQGKIIMDVWFRVQFYVDQVILLREKVTRHQYYLQLKDNVLEYNHVYSEEKCFQQAAYALQADFGNYVEEKHHSGYFHPSVYFPAWILERHGLDYLAHNVPTLHRDLHNMTKNDAKLCYIRNASMSPGALNLHFYMVRKHKNDKHCNTWLAICARGVEIYEDDAGYKSQVSTFMWRDIGKLYFDKKKFEIRSVQSAGGRRFIYYTDCDIKSKYLLSISRSTHMFQMAIQPKLMEIQHLDNEDQKRYRESYVSSDPRDRSHFHHSPSTSTNASVSSNNQRLSVVSDASSNTTSGIVSDRMTVSLMMEMIIAER